MRTSSASRITILLFAFVLMISCTSASTVSKDGKAPGIEPRYYSHDFETVYLGVIDAAQAMEWHISVVDKSLGIISAKTSTSFLTMGDELSIRVHQPKEGKVRVDVSAGPARKMFDLGENKGKIKNFYKQLDQILLPQ